MPEIGWEEHQHKKIRVYRMVDLAFIKYISQARSFSTCFPYQQASCLPLCITAGILYHILPATVHLNWESMTVCLPEGYGCLRLSCIHRSDVSIFLWKSGPSTRLCVLRDPFGALESAGLMCALIFVSVSTWSVERPQPDV